MLAGGLVSGVGCRAGDGAVDAVEELLARGAAEVEGARLHEVLEHAFVEGAGVDARSKVGEILERSVGLAFLKDFLRGLLADALDAGQPKPDGVECRGVA